MTEKISEMSSREEKIKRLKAKINKEIEDSYLFVKAEMIEYLKRNIIETAIWDELTNKAFYFNYLREFINSENAFMSYMYRDENKDEIIFRVSLLNIDIWLQEDYDFTNHLYYQIEKYKGFCCIKDFLNDYFLGMRMLSAFDYTAYKGEISK